MKIKLLFISFFIAVNGFSQPSAEKLYDGIFPRRNPNAPDRMDRWMIDLGHSLFSEKPNNITFKPWSHAFGVSRFLDVPLDKKSRVGFAIGLGLSFQNFYSNGQITYLIDSAGKESTALLPLTPGYEYRTNKLSLHFVELPFQLRFRSGNKHNFFFYPGFKIAYLYSSYTKIVDDITKIKVYRIRGFEEIQYGASVHLGYNRFALWGYYSLSNLFKEKRGIETQLINVGISFNFF